MSWHRAFSLMLTASTLLFLQTCMDKGVDPPPPKDMRKLTWRVDTLYTPGAQTILTDVWGSSSKNVIALGWMSGRHIVYRYNGSEWKVEPIPAPDPPFDALDPRSVTGFGADDIILVGGELGLREGVAIDTAYVIRYNGTRWIKMGLPQGRGLFSVSSISSGEIWAGGRDVVLHWNGVQWKQVQVPLYPQGMQFLSIVALASNDVYMNGFRNDVVQPLDTTAYFLYHYNGTSWSIVDSVIQTVSSPFRSFGSQLRRINNSLFSANSGLWKRQGNGWITIRERDVFRVAGTNEKNMITIDSGGKVYHYDGIDWYQFKQLENPDAELRGIWTDGNEVFIVGFIQGGLRGIIWHGK